jgi:hypothetical protein
VALGDYQEGRSDIDFMAFLSRPVTDPQTVSRLAEVHAGLAGPADYDGNYVALACVPDVHRRRAERAARGRRAVPCR